MTSLKPFQEMELSFCDPDLHFDLHQLIIQQTGQEDAINCYCYGRGKTLKDLSIPRYPKTELHIAKMNQMETMFGDQNVEKRCRGRGRGILRSTPDNLQQSHKVKSIPIHHAAPFLSFKATTTPLPHFTEDACDLSPHGREDRRVSCDEVTAVDSNKNSSLCSGRYASLPVNSQEDYSTNANIDPRSVFSNIGEITQCGGVSHNPPKSWHISDGIPENNTNAYSEFPDNRLDARKNITLEAFMKASKKRKKKKKGVVNEFNVSVDKPGSTSEVYDSSSSLSDTVSSLLSTSVPSDSLVPPIPSPPHSLSRVFTVPEKTVSLDSSPPVSAPLLPLTLNCIPPVSFSSTSMSPASPSGTDSTSESVAHSRPGLLSGSSFLPPTSSPKLNTNAESGEKSGSQKWRLLGPYVVQLDNLPPTCSMSVLHEIVSSYGMIKDSEVIEHNTSSSIRFQLNNGESCDWVVDCLHNSECLFADSQPLKCFRVDKDQVCQVTMLSC